MFDEILDDAAVTAHAIKVQVEQGLAVAKDKITPSFIKRMRAKKIHELNVDTIDG